jgi:hypothetical protein
MTCGSPLVTALQQSNVSFSCVVLTTCLLFLVHCSSFIVETHLRSVPELRVGHDESQAREQLPGMELYR